MIAGIKDIEFEISDILNSYEIEDNVEIRYSNIENTDIQCNNLVRHSNHPDIKDIKKKIKSSLLDHPFIKTVEIAENGFINLNFSNEYLKISKLEKDFKFSLKTNPFPIGGFVSVMKVLQNKIIF